MSDTVTALDALTPDQFFDKPIEQRGEWCLYMSRDMAQIAQGWGQQSDDPLDTFPGWVETSTPQEKVALQAWMVRSAYVSHENVSLILTKEQAYKLTSCSVLDVKSALGKDYLAAVDKLYAANGNGYPGASYAHQGLYRMPHVVDSGDEVVDDEGRTSQQITLGGGSVWVFVAVATRDETGTDAVIYVIK